MLNYNYINIDINPFSLHISEKNKLHQNLAHVPCDSKIGIAKSVSMHNEKLF